MRKVKFFVGNTMGFANTQSLYATDSDDIERRIKDWYDDPYEEFYEIEESEAKKIIYLQGETQPSPKMDYVQTDYGINPSVDNQIKMMIESAKVEFTQYD